MLRDYKYVKNPQSRQTSEAASSFGQPFKCYQKSWKFKQQLIFVEETKYSSQTSLCSSFQSTYWLNGKIFSKKQKHTVTVSVYSCKQIFCTDTQACCFVNNPYLFWVLSIYGSNYIVPKIPAWRYLSSPRRHGASPKVASLEQRELPATSLFGSTTPATWAKLLRNSLSYCFV